MLRRFELFTLIVLLGLSPALFADQVTLKNGDRLTGTVVKSDGKTLVLHTEAAGDVTIQFGAIQEIKTDQELHVSLKGGKTAVGPVTTTDGKLEIATKTAGTVEASKDDVTLIRNDAEQTGLRQVTASRTEARLDWRSQCGLLGGSRKQRDRKPRPGIQRGACHAQRQDHALRQFDRHHK